MRSARGTKRLLAGVLLLVALTAGGTAAAALRPLPSLLLTLNQMPSRFRSNTEAHLVNPSSYDRKLTLRSVVNQVGIVRFQRKPTQLDNSLDFLEIDIIRFRDAEQAHKGFEYLVRNGASSPFHVGRIGAERAGFWASGIQAYKFPRLVNVTTLTIYWRYKNFGFVMSGTYMTKAANDGLPGPQSLVALAQAQQAKLAGVVG